LQEYREKLDDVAEALLEHEELRGERVLALVGVDGVKQRTGEIVSSKHE
jgi:hypothetical protein